MRAAGVRPRAAAALIGVVVAACAVPSTTFGRPFEMGFTDGVFQSGDATLRGPWMDRAVATGADSIDVTAGWASIAPTKPVVPHDPSDPAYRWAALDATVTEAASRGLGVL